MNVTFRIIWLNGLVYLLTSRMFVHVIRLKNQSIDIASCTTCAIYMLSMIMHSSWP